VKSDLLTDLGDAMLSGSLTDELLMAQTDKTPPVRLLPEANVVKIGGQSFIDRGRAAVFPLIDEIVANLPHHKMIIGTGAGTRARHAYSVGLDLGMPTGVLSVLGTFVSMQNARMIHYLLAKHGIPFIEPAQFPQLPLYLSERRATVFFGMPPYTFWQENPAVGRIPPHRTDTGAFLVSEVFAARSMIYVKDEDGLYTKDPKTHSDATLIKRTTLSALLADMPEELILDRQLFTTWQAARHVKRVQIVNGLVRGELTRALAGEDAGTVIDRDGGT